MKQYHKISGPFVRDIEGTGKLIFGKYASPTVEYLKDNVWQFTEKIDGTNIRVHWDGHEVSFGGRTDKAQIPKHLLECLENKFKTDEVEQLFEQLFGEKEVILFGEGYGMKIQGCGSDYIPDGVDFILFDVMINGNYQDRENVESIAKCFNVDIVPIVLEGRIIDAIEFVKQRRKSTIGSAMMEGVVGRPKVELNDRCGNRVIVKIKWEDFKEFTGGENND